MTGGGEEERRPEGQCDSASPASPTEQGSCRRRRRRPFITRFQRDGWFVAILVVATLGCAAASAAAGEAAEGGRSGECDPLVGAVLFPIVLAIILFTFMGDICREFFAGSLCSSLNSEAAASCDSQLNGSATAALDPTACGVIEDCANYLTVALLLAFFACLLTSSIKATLDKVAASKEHAAAETELGMPSCTSNPVANTVVGAVGVETIAVAVPVGAVPGQMIGIQTPTGQEMQVAVPDGLLAGATFQVELPTNAPIRAVSAKPKPRVTRGGVGSDTV